MTERQSSRLWLAGLAILAIQALLTYGMNRDVYLPSPPPLDTFPRALGPWIRSIDGVVEPDIYEMLAPDDLLNRSYEASDSGEGVNLFVAYYKTQHRARNAHSPKVCLPGSGWEPQESKVLSLTLIEGSDPVQANYYVVRKGSAAAVVLYWYQTHNNAVALEQSLKLRRVIDTILESRTDMALVRIVAPFTGDGTDVAADHAIQFATLAYPYLLRQFPAQPAK